MTQSLLDVVYQQKLARRLVCQIAKTPPQDDAEFNAAFEVVVHMFAIMVIAAGTPDREPEMIELLGTRVKSRIDAFRTVTQLDAAGLRGYRGKQ